MDNIPASRIKYTHQFINENKGMSQGQTPTRNSKLSKKKSDIVSDKNNSIVSLKDFVIDGDRSTMATEYIKSDGVYHGEAV